MRPFVCSRNECSGLVSGRCSWHSCLVHRSPMQLRQTVRSCLHNLGAGTPDDHSITLQFHRQLRSMFQACQTCTRTMCTLCTYSQVTFPQTRMPLISQLQPSPHTSTLYSSRRAEPQTGNVYCSGLMYAYCSRRGPFSSLTASSQGGPGCSSFDGLMMEVGPWRIDGHGGLKTIEGGWEEYTTMVYSSSLHLYL